MAYDPFPQGQKPMSSSRGVVIASDQSPVSIAGTVLANLNNTNASVITVAQGSIGAVIIGGSIAASFTPPANQSVSGAVSIYPSSISGVGLFNTNNVGNGSIITVGQGSIAVAIVSGSIAASFTPPANQSVSGTVNIGTGGPVSVTGTMSVLGTVPVTQTTNPWVVQLTSGSIATSGGTTGNSSVVVVGILPNTSVSGAGIFNVNQTGNGSILVLVPGSVATAPSPASVSGVGNFNVIPVGSIAGTYLDTATPTSVTGVAMLFKKNDSTSVMGTPSPANPLPTVGSVSGRVEVTQSGIWATSMVGVASVSQAGNWLIQPGSVSGVGLFNVNQTGNGSILVLIPGSVATVSSPASVSGVGLFNVNQTGNGSIITVSTGSILAALTGGSSVIAVLQAASIAGTYTEDSASTDGDRGLLTFAVRNDTVASLVSANADYSASAVDSAGRVLTKPFAANEAIVYGVSSTVNTNPSSLLGVSGTGLRNYITDLWIANTGSVTTLVSFRDGDASIIGKTIAPAGGGSNIIGLQIPMRTGNLNSPVEFTAATATSILHVTAFGYKAP